MQQSFNSRLLGTGRMCSGLAVLWWLSCICCSCRGQTFYSEQDLMRYINYAKRAKVSISAPNYTPPTVGASQGRKKQRPNPPKVRKEAGKAAAVKQRSKGLMHASNQSDEESDNPKMVSLPSKLPKKVRRDKAPNSASASDDEDAEFHLTKQRVKRQVALR
ncbi:hypothetical protein ACSBR2_004838 [Camellia fascicularis]